MISQVLGIDEQIIHHDSYPESFDGWDSLRHLNVVATHEEGFDIELMNTEMVKNMSSAMAVEIFKLNGVGG